MHSQEAKRVCLSSEQWMQPARTDPISNTRRQKQKCHLRRREELERAPPLRAVPNSARAAAGPPCLAALASGHLGLARARATAVRAEVAARPARAIAVRRGRGKGECPREPSHGLRGEEERGGSGEGA